NETPVIGLEFSKTSTFAVPLEEFYVRVTPTNDPSRLIYEQPFIGVPNTLSLAAAVGVAPDSFFVVQALSCDLSFNAYLEGAHNASTGIYNTFYEALLKSGVEAELKDDGQFTLFVPLDKSFADVPEAQQKAVFDDPQILSAWVHQHI